jgi:hypothetical protein
LPFLNQGKKNRNHFFVQALAANAEKIEPMGQNLESGFVSHLFGHVDQAAQFRIDYLFALRAYNVGMRERLVAVIAIAAVRETKLQDFVDFFQKGNGLVNRVKAGRRELGPDLFRDLIDGRMFFTGGQDSQYRQPLGRDAEIVVLEL